MARPLRFQDLHISWECAAKQIKEKDGEACVSKPQSEYHWAQCPRREPENTLNKIISKPRNSTPYERILTFMENHMKKILLYGLSVRSSKGTSWIPGEMGLKSDLNKFKRATIVKYDCRCSPLVSTPNVNNFLDIRSQTEGMLDAFDAFFSESMFILWFWRYFASGGVTATWRCKARRILKDCRHGMVYLSKKWTQEWT